MMRHWIGSALVMGALLATGLALRADAGGEARPDLTLSDCPPAVQKTLQAEAKGAGIQDVHEDPREDETQYIAHVTIKGRHYSITVCEHGTLIQKQLENEDEREIRLADCPSPVRKALNDEADGAAIDTVEKDTKAGHVSYTAGVEIDGNYYWITVAADGTLIDKTLDDEAEDDADQPDETAEEPVLVVVRA